MIHPSSSRGFTLLISIILSSVVLTLALALVDVSYKQIVLASSAKQSQYAFYNADGALECALYYDQKLDFFNSNPSSLPQGNVTCDGQAVSFSVLRSGASPKTTIFTIPCAAGGTKAQVTVYKNSPSAPTHSIFASGYNTCNTADPRRIERGLEVLY